MAAVVEEREAVALGMAVEVALAATKAVAVKPPGKAEPDTKTLPAWPL